MLTSKATWDPDDQGFTPRNERLGKEAKPLMVLPESQPPPASCAAHASASFPLSHPSFSPLLRSCPAKEESKASHFPHSATGLALL